MKLILVRGLPGSGKSTFARSMLSTTDSAEHYEADQYFVTKEGNYVFDINNIHQAHLYCQEATENALRDGKTVIVSNTFTTIRELRPYFVIAQSLGIIPNVILCQSNFKNIHDVPIETLVRMKNRFVYDISNLIKEYEII